MHSTGYQPGINRRPKTPTLKGLNPFRVPSAPVLQHPGLLSLHRGLFTLNPCGVDIGYSKKILAPEAHEIIAGYDHMIIYRDAKDLAAFSQAFGKLNVGGGGFIVSRRMIMNE